MENLIFKRVKTELEQIGNLLDLFEENRRVDRLYLDDETGDCDSDWSLYTNEQEEGVKNVQR